MSFMPIRGGPRIKDCPECREYEFVRVGYERYRWLVEVDGRAVNHYRRHLSNITYLPQWSDIDRMMGDGAIPKIRRTGDDCRTCSQGFMILRNLENYRKEWTVTEKKFGRHYELHQGFEKYGGIYRDEWEEREELRSAEHEFFETMNAHHVTYPFSWHRQWVAIDREAGHAFEQERRRWTTKSDSFVVMSVFRGYPNNVGGYQLASENRGVEESR